MARVWFQLVNRNGEPVGPADGVDLRAGAQVLDLRHKVTDPRFGSRCLQAVAASNLKVYKDLEAYCDPEQNLLLADNDVEDLGKSTAAAIIVEVPRVWFQLTDADTGDAFSATRVDWVPLTEERSVQDLGDAVFDKVSRVLPENVIATSLRIYASSAAYDQEDRAPLDSSDSLAGLGKDAGHPLIVEVPRPASFLTKRLADVQLLADEVVKKIKVTEPGGEKNPILMNSQALVVSEDEFQLDKLSAKQESGNPVVMTPGLHSFWQDLGDFPPSYLVRKEEVLLWQLTKSLIPTVRNERIVIVGSPGVGKSCFLMLVGMYLAFVEKKKVLIIRRVKGSGDVDNSVVYLNGEGSFARAQNVTPAQLYEFRDRVKEALVLVDGYSQEELKVPATGLSPFHFLATSCRYDKKFDDRSRLVVLPAWQRDDLLLYARLTDWVVGTGLRKTKRLADSTWPKLVNKQYFYSGGSLREFCKTPNVAKDRMTDACGHVTNGQAFQLVYTFGGDRSKDQVDRVRRHYISDRNNVEHYTRFGNWQVSVDSGHALKLLGKYGSMEKQLEVYKYAQYIGAGFLDATYEQLLHHAVHEAYAKNSPVVLTVHTESEYDEIQLCVPRVECSGEDENECYCRLVDLAAETYWHPDYPFFPFIDAVVMCQATRRGSDETETIVAYLQMTISNEKTFKPERLRRLNEAVDKNPKLVNVKRALVVVGPDPNVCSTFTLHDAPRSEEFMTLVSCFDPRQLDHKYNRGTR
ncbi:hypothetical protein PHYPSEUDO_008370 [Phytophthora pseudosyringae]|uniref:Crinkler (CRN) family protein n=1 Tax=Phytophthora pseudosyringae TaxID=221518 RepID=A0A8T1W8E3_9STRA|nr:hypothetical protein PHYPSEUDO_008370 [Phytophthora pseudosyringae]